MRKWLNNRGDTIVEVMLAAVILSVVLAGAYNLSSRATRLNQSAFERTSASNHLQEQIELLKAAQREQDPAVWDRIVYTLGTQAYFDCRSDATGVVPNITPDVFYLTGDGSALITVEGAVKTSGVYNTWITRKNNVASNYVDFYVYTCWEGLGSIGDQASGTVVRLEVR